MALVNVPPVFSNRPELTMNDTVDEPRPMPLSSAIA